MSVVWPTGVQLMFSFAPELVSYSAPRDLHLRAAYSICESWFLIHQKISYDEHSSVRFKNIKRFETELKWIKLLQTPFPLGFNDNIYHEGNISKMPDFDVLTLSESRKRKSRSHGIRKKGNDKRKRCATMKLNTSLNDLAVKLRIHGRHPMLSYLSSLPIAVLRSLDTEANRFYDRNHQMYDAALLTRCYTQHALRPFIDFRI